MWHEIMPLLQDQPSGINLRERRSRGQSGISGHQSALEQVHDALSDFF